MASIDDLIANIMGQTDTALNAPPAPWQQELLETVNPQKVKRQNIARALAQASTAMATTPGNFLAGVSAAAATGADSYLTGKDQAEDERIKVQQLVQMQGQKDQDRRLSLLMDAIGVQRNQIQDKQSAEESKARTDYYNRRGTGAAPGNGLTQSQILTTKRAIRGELRTLENQLLESAKLDESLTPEAIESAIAERQMELEEYYGITLDAPDTPQQGATPKVQQPAAPGAAPGRNITQADLFAPQGGAEEVQQPAITAPPSGGIRDGATATNKQTGERVIYRNGQWQPL